jgi:hypothetical protein
MNGKSFRCLRGQSATESLTLERQSNGSQRRSEGSALHLPSSGQIEALLSGSSSSTSLLKRRSSASSAHTADVPDGSALSGGMASRDVRTLDAAGSARVGGFVTDISPRASATSVAVVPRSAYCEQFRALRTRCCKRASAQTRHGCNQCRNCRRKNVDGS